MTSMPLWQQIATIALCVLGTMTTRFLPFLIFKPGSRLPGYVKYLGKALPSAVFALLVVYCLKDVSLLSGSHGIPEALGMGLTALLHLWRRQMLLSMAGGTLFYMFLVQYIFFICFWCSISSDEKNQQLREKRENMAQKKSTCEYSFFHGDRYGIRTHTLCAENAAS